MYEYNCKILRVVDGDTVDVDIDLGFNIWLRGERIRMNGIDAPESRTSDKVEKVFGLAAKERLKALLAQDVILKTFALNDGSTKEGKFGRILGDFITEDDRLVTEILIEEGHCVRYYGQNKAEIEQAHMANRNLLMENGSIDPKEVQEAQLKMK